MGYAGAFPYLALMLCLAILPVLTPKIWHRYENPILAGISIWTVIILYLYFGTEKAIYEFFHMIFHEYIAFMAIIFSLFVVSSGILVRFHIANSLKNNLYILLCGSILANFIGTTGASMVLIRPFLELNKNKAYKTHLGVFFIFLVSNIGGCLTPLGDPPLFMGFLKGVSFFWTLQHGWLPFLMALVTCLGAFALVDRLKNKATTSEDKIKRPAIRVRGAINVILVLCIITITLFASTLSDEPMFKIYGHGFSSQDLVRDFSYLLITIISLLTTPKFIHEENHFNFSPVNEVARVFFVIFLTLIPLSYMLKLGHDGPFAFLYDFANPNDAHHEIRYFWLTGLMSGFLDNAPTYLLFFKMAGDDANLLMNTYPEILLAISLGAVFMGAITYIGNAPNFMVRSIAIQKGVKMPSFLGYIVWSSVILLPIYLIISYYLKYF